MVQEQQSHHIVTSQQRKLPGGGGGERGEIIQPGEGGVPVRILAAHQVLARSCLSSNYNKSKSVPAIYMCMYIYVLYFPRKIS